MLSIHSIKQQHPTLFNIPRLEITFSLRDRIHIHITMMSKTNDPLHPLSLPKLRQEYDTASARCFRRMIIYFNSCELSPDVDDYNKLYKTKNLSKAINYFLASCVSVSWYCVKAMPVRLSGHLQKAMMPK